MRASRRKKTVAAVPTVPFFISAALAVLFARFVSPNVFFWVILIGFFSGFLFVAASINCLRLRKTEDRENVGFAESSQLDSACFDSNEDETKKNFFYQRLLGSWRAALRLAFAKLLLGNVCAWLVVAGFYGLRYELFVNYFPLTEVARFVNKDGWLNSLKIRVKNTPTLYCNDDIKFSFQDGSRETTSFIAEVLAVQNNGNWEKHSGRILVSVDGNATFLRVEDEVMISGRLSLLSRSSNPGDFDRQLYYRTQRVLTKLNVDKIETIVLLKDYKQSFTRKIARFFEKLRRKAGKIVAENLKPRNAAVAQGMTLGFRNDVDEDTNDSFRKTGTIHLLAISGLHITLIVGACVFLLKRCGVPVPVVAIVTIALVFFYMGLIDVRTPVVRASVLIVTIAVGRLIGKRGIALNTLVFSALIVLAINPCELFQLGAQLSFLATGTFLWTSNMTIREHAMLDASRLESIRERERLMDKKYLKRPSSFGFGKRDVQDDLKNLDGKKTEKNSLAQRFRNTTTYGRLNSTLFLWLKSFWKNTLSVTKSGSCVWIVSSPLILRTTNWFTPISLVANPLIWLPATISLLLAFLLIFGGLASAATSGSLDGFIILVARATDYSFDLFLGILDLFASPSFGAFRIPAPIEWTLWLFYLPLGFWTLFPFYRPRRLGLGVFLLLWIGVASGAFVYDREQDRKNETLRVDFFSVGHGCAVLGVFPDGRTFLYDCGSLGDSKRSAEIVAKNLWNAKKSRIDLVFISHADYDHYGGLERLVELVGVDRVCVSSMMFNKETVQLKELEELLIKKRIPIETVAAGDSLDRWRFAEIKILHPNNVYDDPNEDSNANSIVALLEYKGRSILLPGDLDDANANFLDTAPIECDVMLLPHHGGSSKSLVGLLAWAYPKQVVISGGNMIRNYRNEEELRKKNYCVLHTADDGCVQVSIENSRDPSGKLGRCCVQTYSSHKRFDSEDERN